MLLDREERSPFRTFGSKGTVGGPLLLAAHPRGFAIQFAQMRLSAVRLGAAGYVH